MKKHTGLLILSILALLFFGGSAFFMRNLLFGGIAATYEEAVDNYSEYSEKWISYDVVACLGPFAEYTETQYFIPTSHKYYYVCWMEDGAMMPMCVSDKKDREYLDALTEATYDYVDGKTEIIEVDPRTFVGTVSATNKDVNMYYNDALKDLKATESDGVDVKYVLLDCAEDRAHYILLVGAVMLIPILGFVVCFVGIRKDKKKQENEPETYLPR